MSSIMSKEKKCEKKQHRKVSDKSRIESVKLYPALRNTVYGRVYGYINDKGTFVIEPKYQNAYDFNEFGIAIVWENSLAGVINAQGEYVVKPSYASINPYKEGRAIYTLKDTMGVMDEKGNRITKKAYNFISDYNDGRATVGVNNLDGVYDYGYIDRDGNEVIPTQFLQANQFEDGVAIIKTKDNKYGLIDKDGKLINTYNHVYVSQYGEGVMVFADSLNGPFGVYK